MSKPRPPEDIGFPVGEAPIEIRSRPPIAPPEPPPAADPEVIPPFNPDAGNPIDDFLATVGGFLGGPLSAALTAMQNAARQTGAFQVGATVDRATGQVTITNPCIKGKGPNCVRQYTQERVDVWERELTRFARTGFRPPGDRMLQGLVGRLSELIAERGRPLGYSPTTQVRVPDDDDGPIVFEPPGTGATPGGDFTGTIFGNYNQPGVPGGGVPLNRSLPVGFSLFTPAMQLGVLNAMRSSMPRRSSASGTGRAVPRRRRKSKTASASRKRRRNAGPRRKASTSRKSTRARVSRSRSRFVKGSAAAKRYMAALRRKRRR